MRDLIRLLLANLRRRALEWLRRADPDHVPVSAIRRYWLQENDR